MAACMDHEEPTQADGALETENLEAPCPGGREEEMSEVCWSLWPLLCAPHCYVRPHLPRGADEGSCREHGCIAPLGADEGLTAVLPRSLFLSLSQVDIWQGWVDRVDAQEELLRRGSRQELLDLEFRNVQALAAARERWTRVGRPCNACEKMRCERPRGSVRYTRGGDVYFTRNQWNKPGRRCEKCLEDVYVEAGVLI